MGVLKILFLVFLSLFPLVQVGRIQLPNGVAFTINDIVLAVVVGVWLLLRVIKKGDSLQRNSLFTPIALFIIFGFISLLLNSRFLAINEFVVALFYLLRWTLYVSIYFIVSEFPLSFKKKVFNFLIIPGTTVVVIGYIQYFFYPSLRNLFYAGWDEHLYRMFSSFLDPSFAGAFFSLFALYVFSRGVLYWDEKKMTHLFLVAPIGLLTLVAVFLTYSRGAILMLLVSGVALLLLRFGNALRKSKRTILVVCCFFIVVMLLIVSSPKAFQTEGTDLFRVASIIGRIDAAKAALTIIRENPLIGVGFNAYRYAQVRYGFREQPGVSHADAGTDNSFLFVLATTGIIGFILYFNIWRKVLFVKDSSKKKDRWQQLMHILVVASSIGILVNTNFANSLFYPFIMQWFWILIGLRENT